MSLTRRKFIKAGFLVSLGTLILDSFWLEKAFIEVNRFNLSGDSINAIKLFQISDLHLNNLHFYHHKVAEKINAEHPDLVVITGDAIDKAENISLLNGFLNLIDKEINKVAILGNWEYWGEVNIPELKKVYEAHNCALLVNECKQFAFRNKTITITGVDDFVGGHADIEKAIKHYQKSDYHVILNHCPEYSNILPHKIYGGIKSDLILSGHTHGGQVNLFGIIPFLPPGSGKFIKGWYKDEYKNLYVSKGIGTSLLPVRFGARAEVAIFNL